MRSWMLATCWAITAPAGCEPEGGEPSEALAEVLDQPFHREGMVDATNLIIRSEGTLEWKIFGCDFGGGDQAPWTAEGDTVVAVPDPGASYNWIGDFGVLSEVARITITPKDDGEAVVVHLTFANGDPGIEQEWVRGGVCAQCGGSLGPTGQEACDDPFTSQG